MLKIIFLLLLCNTSFCKAYTETDSSGKKKKFSIFKQHQPQEIIERPFAKNTVIAQLGGDSPYMGFGYRRRITNKEKLNLEVGVSAGFAPFVFDIGPIDLKKSNYNFAHNVTLVYRSKRFFAPTVGYSGVFYNRIFYKNKTRNYLPVPNIGLRIGKANSVAFNILWSAYFFNRLSYETNDQLLFTPKKQSLVLSIPSFNLQYSF